MEIKKSKHVLYPYISFALMVLGLQTYSGNLHAQSGDKDPIIKELSSKYEIDQDAVECLYNSIQAGNGTMAQYNHPGLGGMGQWMAGGSVMSFNWVLAGKITQMANAISQKILERPSQQSSQPAKVVPVSPVQQKPVVNNSNPSFTPFAPMKPMAPMTFSFPQGNGEKSPDMSGAQNGTSYKYFKNDDVLEITKNGSTKKIILSAKLVGVSQEQDQQGHQKFVFKDVNGKSYGINIE